MSRNFWSSSTILLEPMFRRIAVRRSVETRALGRHARIEHFPEVLGHERHFVANRHTDGRAADVLFAAFVFRSHDHPLGIEQTQQAGLMVVAVMLRPDQIE